MFRRVSRLSGAFLMALLIGGCASSYVDPKYQDVAMTDIQAPSARHRLRLRVEFQTNGTPNERAAKYFHERVEAILQKTGVVELVKAEDTAAAEELTLMLNNVGDVNDAMRKGFGTGLTFGLVGTMVTDGYILQASYVPGNGKSKVQHQYEHAIYTTIGNAEGPKGLKAMSTVQAFDKVVEDMLMVFFRDLQKQGYLVWLNSLPNGAPESLALRQQFRQVF